ncbi:hypothetical protein [Mycobacterium marinum]|uniref:hypothetical protein n=1 Tax=Mycobacterium marinum TaxID=1781 RepID=UPI003564F0F8
MGDSSDIQVSAAGLAALASRCTTHATTLNEVTAPAAAGLGGQPSAGAVRAAHTAVQATAAKLVTRLSDTAAAASTAVRSYTSTDQACAAAIGAVPDGLIEV